jgi:hypothetical protein
MMMMMMMMIQAEEVMIEERRRMQLTNHKGGSLAYKKRCFVVDGLVSGCVSTTRLMRS